MLLTTSLSLQDKWRPGDTTASDALSTLSKKLLDMQDQFNKARVDETLQYYSQHYTTVGSCMFYTNKQVCSIESWSVIFCMGCIVINKNMRSKSYSILQPSPYFSIVDWSVCLSCLLFCHGLLCSALSCFYSKVELSNWPAVWLALSRRRGGNM